MTQQSTLILVGAGPGDPDLITVKGIKALKEADIVLYDALIDPELLYYCKKACIKQYVGKRAGQHSLTQKEICNLIIKLSNKYKTIVRLKGGDSFVFGRATEEIEAARSAGMEVKVVQGISSALAVPASAFIPLTSRGISQSFWVATGTTKDGKLSKDIYLAAQSTATIVLLMAMNHLPEIMSVFLNYNRGNTPVAIIQEGCTGRQKMICADVNNICRLAEEHQMSNPSVVIIGDVVLSQQELSGIASLKQAI